MKLEISSICAINAGEEVKINFLTVGDNGQTERTSLIIPSKQYLTLKLSKGECGTELYDELAHSAEVWSAVKRGTSLLSGSACSEKALRVKLTSKGYDKEIAEEAVKELVSLGLMNPFDDAFREAQKQFAKLRGKKRIAAELFAKGYSAQAVRRALNKLDLSGADFVAGCRRLIEKRYAELPQEPHERQKLYAALMRCGYTTSEISQAIDELE